jgi:hypothetical protein
MYHIATTRFTNDTWKQNADYRMKMAYAGCIYGCPIKIKEAYPENVNMIILEMNNSINKIEGIGIIKNKVQTKKRRKIYNDGNYNRYIYTGNKRIDRSSLSEKEIELISIIETILFYSPRHLKRGNGIKEFPKWIDLLYDFDFNKALMNLLKSHK